MGVACLAIALLAPWVAAPAHADDAAAAKASFERGVIASEAGDWVAARAEFEASRRHLPKASTLFNLALCEIKLGLGERALETLAAFDEVARPALHAHLVERAQGLRLEAEAIATRSRLRALEQALAEQEARIAARAAVPVSRAEVWKDDDKQTRAGYLAGSLLGTGVTLGLGAGALAVWWHNRSEERDVCHRSESVTCRERQQITRQYRAAVASTLIAAGSATTFLTVGVLRLRKRRHASRAALGLNLGSAYSGLQTRLEF